MFTFYVGFFCGVIIIAVLIVAVLFIAKSELFELKEKIFAGIMLLALIPGIIALICYGYDVAMERESIKEYSSTEWRLDYEVRAMERGNAVQKDTTYILIRKAE